MRISNCIDCKEYKYLVRNGKCRNCISSELYLGTDKKGDDILIKKSQIYKNINISGVTGTGRTTMALNICRQFNNEHGIIYFNFKDELDKQKFDAETICIGKSDMFHLFNTIRDKKDNNYLKEINETSYLYSHIIVNNCDSHIGPTDVRVLGAILTFLFDSNKNLSFADLYKCVSDLNFRRNLIHNANKKLKNKSLCKVMDYEFESKFKEHIKKLCEDIPNSKNKIKISDIITNNKNVVINFEPNLSKKIIPLLTVLNMNKIFKHLDLKNQPKKYKSIFVLDRFEILKDYKELQLTNLELQLIEKIEWEPSKPGGI